MNTLRASLMLGIAGCSYGLNLVVMRMANMAGYFREDLMVAQYLFASLLLGAVVLARFRVKVRPAQFARLCVVGFFGFACSFCVYESIRLTSTAVGVTMLFQYVWIGILFDAMITRKVPSAGIIAAMLLVVAGTPLAAGLLDGSREVNAPGLIWGFLSGAAYAGMLWTSARLETGFPSVFRTFSFAVAELIFSSIAFPAFFTTSMLDPGTWSFAIPIALVAVVIPCLLIMKAAPQVPVGITTIMTGLELPAVLVFGWMLVGETHSPLAIAGAVLICAGIVVANWEGIVELRRRMKANA